MTGRSGTSVPGGSTGGPEATDIAKAILLDRAESVSRAKSCEK